MPRLIGNSHEIAGKIFELSESVVTVGRTPNNLIHLPDNSVSSRHAEMRLEGADYLVKDLDSTNGTRVNGEKVNSHALRRNDVLRFGNMELVYESEHEPVLLPLPELNRGVNLDGCLSRGRPAHFANSGNSGKPKKREFSKWTLGIVLAGGLALGALGYYFVSILSIG